MKRKIKTMDIMNKNVSSENKPLVGFFPLFYNLAETGRAVLIAKEYMKMGGKAIFFSHGGEYEYLAKDIGCEVVRVNPIYTEEFIDLLWKSSRLETLKNPFTVKNLRLHVKEEIKAYKKTGVKFIVSTNNFPCSISARAVEIPLIFVTPKVKVHFTNFPDFVDFPIIRFVPKFIKLGIINFIASNPKIYVKPFIKVAKKYNVKVPKNDIDIGKGDITLYTNYPHLVGLNKSEIPPDEIYIGPILLEELFKSTIKNMNHKKEEQEIQNHLNKKGRSILFSLGSSGTKEFFLKILNTLNKTNYNVIAVYTNILKQDDLPNVNQNILLKKFVPSIKKINQNVDLAILHGGQGTVFTAVYSGKPVIGIPMQFEQHLNLEMLVDKGMAIIASRKYYNEKEFLGYINEIFDNYSKYLKNSIELVKELPPADGHIQAAKVIAKYVTDRKL